MEKAIHILVPMDFSGCSENALVYALQLANKLNARISLIHALDYDGSESENFAFVVDEIEERKEQATMRMQAIINKLSTGNLLPSDGDPPILTNVELGRVSATICDEAARKKADYIIMGTQGVNSAVDSYLGSTASNVLKSAPCSVLVIPDNTEVPDQLAIAYATEFSDADPFGIWKTMKLFQAFPVVIKCVHLQEEEATVEDKLEEFKHYFAETSSKLDIEFYSIPAKDRVQDMNEFIEEQGINVLTMYKPKRSLFESIFHQSYTQQMAKYTTIPLLVFKEE